MKVLAKQPVEAWQYQAQPAGEFPKWLDRASEAGEYDISGAKAGPILAAGPYGPQGDPAVIARPGDWLVFEHGHVRRLSPAEFAEQYA